MPFRLFCLHLIAFVIMPEASRKHPAGAGLPLQITPGSFPFRSRGGAGGGFPYRLIFPLQLFHYLN